MRNLVSAIVAVSLVSSTLAFAGETLAPGKPAGVQKAQGGGFGMTEVLVFGAVAGVIAGVAIATSGGRSSPQGSNQPIVTVSTSTT